MPAAARVAPTNSEEATKLVPGSDEEIDAAIESMLDPWWVAAGRGHRATGGSPEDFKNMIINDNAQYGLVAALMATILVPMVLAKASDYAPGKQDTWQAKVYLISSLLSVCFWLLSVAMAVGSMVVINAIPAPWIYQFWSYQMKSYLRCWPVPFFILGVLSVVPAITAGVYVMDGRAYYSIVSGALLSSTAVVIVVFLAVQAPLVMNFVNARVALEASHVRACSRSA